MKNRNKKEIKWKEGKMHHFLFYQSDEGLFQKSDWEIVDRELFVYKDVEQHEQGIDDISERLRRAA
jgi:hypothetical protein